MRVCPREVVCVHVRVCVHVCTRVCLCERVSVCEHVSECMGVPTAPPHTLAPLGRIQGRQAPAPQLLFLLLTFS